MPHLVLLLVMLWLPATPAAAKATLSWLQVGGTAMGSTWTVKAAFADKFDARTLKAQVQIELDAVDKSMSTYRNDSTLSLFNQSTSTEPFAVDEGLYRVVNLAQDVAKATDGAFDITAGPLIALWGFEGDAVQAVPSQEALNAAREHVGYTRVSTSKHNGQYFLRKHDPQVRLNVSGIASGYAVDRVGERLKQLGARAFFVEAAGEVVVHGQSERGAPFSIGIQSPIVGASHDAIYGAVALPKAGLFALTTSGTTRQFFLAERGERYSHILDARSGWPIKSAVKSVTVVAPTALEADAWDTAFLILGPVATQQLLRQHPRLGVVFIEGESSEHSLPPGAPSGKARPPGTPPGNLTHQTMGPVQFLQHPQDASPGK